MTGARINEGCKTMREKADYRVIESLGGLEVLDAQYEHQNFSRHSHEGYTVGVIESGAQSFFRTGENHIAAMNRIILVNADEVHTGRSATEGGWSYQAMYPLAQQLEKVAEEVFPHYSGSFFFPHAVVDDLPLANALRRLFHQVKYPESQLASDAMSYQILAQLLERHAKFKASKQQLKNADQQLNRVKEFLCDYPQANVSLDDLSSLSGISPYHLIRLFKQRYGLPPHAYQVQQRLRQVRQLLKLGLSVAAAAQEAGFHDQSHLNRHFKRAHGYTAKQYRVANAPM